jgi:guanylate kinase
VIGIEQAAALADRAAVGEQGQGAHAADERADGIIADLRAIGQPRLIVISGPSGVGKDTIIDRMRVLYPAMHFAVTATTRAKRPGEVDGFHYHFYTPERFTRELAAGEFLEHASVYGNYYGVPRTPIRQALAAGQDVVLKVDPQGAEHFRRLTPTGIFIFIAPPSMVELERRLRVRKADDAAAMERRLRTARRELATVELFDYVVFNESAREDDTVAQIMAILTAERRRLHQPEVAV